MYDSSLSNPWQANTHDGRFVSVIGTLTDVTFIHGDWHQGVEVTVEHIASLGHPHGSGGKFVSDHIC